MSSIRWVFNPDHASIIFSKNLHSSYVIRILCTKSKCFSNSNKNRDQQKITRALRTNNSSLRKSYHSDPPGPHSLTDQKQFNMFKIENGATVVNIFHFRSPTGLRNIKSLVKLYIKHYVYV